MMVFMLTTEGYSREDGNVYYSHPLVVHNADESHYQDIEGIIAKALEPYGGKMDSADYILFEAGFDSPGDDYDTVFDEVEQALRAGGFYADRPHVRYIIADTRTQHS